MANDLLLELGVEEIPPKESPVLAQQLSNNISDALAKERLEFSEVEYFHTPRRLVVHVKNLEESQEEIATEVRGPAKKAAFDEDGNPTKAALGFCKGHGVDIADIYTQQEEGREYIFAKKTIPGRETSEILADLLPSAIDKLAPSETMRWDESGLKFVRPMRWICALFADAPVSFSYGLMESQTKSRGHRFLGEPEISISDIPSYFTKLQQNGVILKASDRTALIKDSLQNTASEVGAEPSYPESLIAEIANNLEHPAPVLGEVHESYLSLPREILETTIIEHQKFVPFVVDERPSKYFVGFRDGSDGSDDLVQQGYERVVRARLADSEFFFNTDRQTRLSDRVDELGRVVFQEKLGTILDKVERMRRIAGALAKKLDLSHQKDIDRAILLCKTDLLTLMVGEFAELQGIVGGIYARLEGESELVSQGIYEHYLPESPEDPIPQSETGIIASLADKLDSVAGSLLMGEEVTGSRDPFGIRRKANGIIRIALDHELDVDFFALLEDLSDIYEFLDGSVELDVVKDFLKDRLYGELRDSRGFAYDIADAIVAPRNGNFYRSLKKAVALNQIREDDRFQSLVTAFSRARSITRKETSFVEVDPGLFSDEAEEILWNEYQRTSAEVEELGPSLDFEEIIEKLVALRDHIDRYFDEVLVMADDEAVRSNRLAFLNKIVQLFFSVGDLDKIVVEGE